MLEYNRENAVLFLVFNRPDTTSEVFEAIRAAAPKKLYIAADGPRSQEESQKCDEVRAIVKNITWDCELKTLFRTENLGCRNSVSDAITWFFDNEVEGIILEDDCLPSSSFFGFCSAMLAEYRDDDRVGHIAGSNFQKGIIRGDGSYYFSRLPHVWGWASWRRAWNKYDVNMASFPNFKKSDLANIASHAPYKEAWFTNLASTYNKQINTWDYQYAYSNLINNYVGIIPNQNLIKNIGFGANATHTINDNGLANLETGEINSIVHPTFFIPDVEADLYTQQIEFYQAPVKMKDFLARIWKKIKGFSREKSE